jgi:hypothetical protein
MPTANTQASSKGPQFLVKAEREAMKTIMVDLLNLFLNAPGAFDLPSS